MKSMDISSVKREHVEAYVYATNDHRGRPDWEDIMEKVYPMAVRAFTRLGLGEDLENPEELPAEELFQQHHFVEDSLVTASPEFQEQIFENILKNEGIFE